VLENDEIYTLYGITDYSGFGVAGFVHGRGSSSNGVLTASDMKDFSWTDYSGVSGRLSATYTPNVSFNGTLIEGGENIILSGTSINAAVFDYHAAANLSHITGTWRLTGMQGDDVTMSISNNGTFTAISGGCSFNGEIAPRASGKNVFNFTMTFGGSPCLLPYQSATGIAVEYLLPTFGVRQLLMAGVNSSRTAGSSFFGTR
jgi:hypothetical protein